MSQVSGMANCPNFQHWSYLQLVFTVMGRALGEPVDDNVMVHIVIGMLSVSGENT